MPRLALSLRFWSPPLALPEALRIARRAGLAGVEIPFPYGHEPARLRRWLEAAGLQLALLNCPIPDAAGDEPGIACRPQDTRRFRLGVAEAARYCEALGCCRVNVLAGRTGGERPAAIATLQENLHYAAGVLEGVGAVALLEPLNGHDVPGYAVPDCESARHLIASVGHRNLRLLFDAYHCARSGHDPLHLFHVHRELIGHVQFADVPGRGAPGTGSIDFGRLIGAIVRAGYAGWLGAEYLPGEHPEESLFWIPGLLHIVDNRHMVRR